MVPKQSRILVMNILRGATHDAITVRLAKTAPVPADADLVLSDFDECNFAGYVPQNPVWGAPALDGSFVAYMVTGTVAFVAGGGLLAPQTICAVYCTYNDPTDGGTEKLLFCERLAPTVTLAAPGETFSKILKMGDTNF
jgi:hypothetical protein